MKRIIALILALLVPLCAFGALAEPGNKLGMDILLSLLDGKSNRFVSPVSLDLALALAACGSEGETKAEILAALEADTLKDATSFSAALEKSGLKIANAAFVKDGLVLKADYASGIQREMDAEILPLNSLSQVNSWVNEHTDGLIPSLPLSGIDDIMLMLINAIAIDARWEEPFDGLYTCKQNFHAPDGDVEVDMMYNTLVGGYVETDGLQLLRLDYRDCDLYMLLALPHDGDVADALKWLGDHDLNALEYPIQSQEEIVSEIVERAKQWGEVLDEETISWLNARYMGGMPYEVALALPKLDIQCSTDLTEPLKQQGILKAFDPVDAGFAPISDTPLYVTVLRQELRLQVDEEGTKAAAVTYELMDTMAANPMYERKPVNFTCDRPFALLIIDETSGEICFAGAVMNPTK